MARIIVRITKQDAEKRLARVPDESVFWCHDGSVFHDMQELADGLNKMSDETFAHHSNAEKTDFSNWVKDIIGDEKLSRDLAKAKDRTQAAKFVTERLNFLISKLA